MAAEGVSLVDHGLGVVQLAIGSGEEAVPEEGDFFLQGPRGVDHAVEPVRLGALDEHDTVLVYVVAAEKGVVPLGGVFRMQEPLNRCLVALRKAFLQLLEGCPESGPPQKMGHQG